MNDHQTIMIKSPLPLAKPSCMFCFEDILSDDHIITKDGCQCAITFHTKCIQTWIQMYENHECPICRANVSFIILSPQSSRKCAVEIVLLLIGLITILVAYFIYLK